MTSYLAKGLEFDTVIINDASNQKYNSNSKIDMHLLYVAMTRALHELNICYKDKLNLTLEEFKGHQMQEDVKRLTLKKDN